MTGALAMGANNITMTGSLGETGARLTKGWFADLEATNPIAGSITGNAATATNLTGLTASVANLNSVTGALGTAAFTPTGNYATAAQGATADAALPKAGGTMTGALAMGANNITMTGSLGETGARLTKGWFTDLEATNPIAGSITGNALNVTGTVAIANGGTGATTAAAARTNLELGALATQSTIVTGDITDSTIATADLADGAITKAKIAADGCAAGNILKYSAGPPAGWTCAADATGAGALVTELANVQTIATTERVDFDGSYFVVAADGGDANEADITLKDAGITNAKLAGLIEDGKLNQITTASKVSGAALTLLANIPAAAGAIPTDNMPANVSYLGADIASAEIANDTIVDADINTGAAIAISKLATTGSLGLNVLASSVAAQSIWSENQIVDGAIVDA
ncbi:MAG TPA: hypothetical protein DEQ38_13475, partial [Elusimicrobia bacterium]|nr:hypothetical protein [Elusimicrobiota bacterium]